MNNQNLIYLETCDPDRDVERIVNSKPQRARREARREAQRRARIKKQLQYLGWAFLAGMLFERILIQVL